MMKKYFYGGLLSLVAGTLFSLGLHAQEIRVQVDDNEIITTVADTTLVVEILQRIAGEVRRVTPGEANDGEATARAALVAARALLDQLAGKALEDVVRDTDRDHFMSADEACAWGLIDKVVIPKA